MDWRDPVAMDGGRPTGFATPQSITFINLPQTIALYAQLLRIPVKSITNSGMNPITYSGQIDHASERSDAGDLLSPETLGCGQIFGSYKTSLGCVCWWKSPL
jgi:hypothetical protein